MRWIEATIKTHSSEIDGLTARLTALGVDGLCIEDEADFRQFLENNRQYWDYVDEELNERFAGRSLIKFYLADDEEGRARLRALRDALPETVDAAYIADEDWENNWREFYKPIPVGERLIVVPEWESPELDGRTALRLDPGLIFGSGSHATTKMCLAAIQDIDLAGKRVLDLGCGSGILGIGAMVLGCASVTGCDIDPKAPDVALSNARLNGITDECFKIYAGDILSDEGMRAFLGTGYDVVLANIVADVIIPLSGLVRQFMAPGAVFICSGIIDGRQDEVRAALEKNGLTVVEHRTDEEWHCFVCR